MLHFAPWKAALILAVCLLSVVLAIPNVVPQAVRDGWPSWAPRNAVALGLDLQGGSYMLLEVQSGAIVTERLEALTGNVRQALRGADLGYTGLAVEGGAVRLRLRDLDKLEQARAVLQGLAEPVDQNLLGGAAQMNLAVEIAPDGLTRMTLTEPALAKIAEDAVVKSLEVVRRRIDELGTREPTIQRQGADRILVQVPGLDDPKRLIDLLGQTAKMTFHLVDEAGMADAMGGRVPPGTQLLYTSDAPPQPVLIRKRVEISGDSLIDAQSGFDQRTGEPIVSFKFDLAGARKFADISTQNVGQRFAIVLDDKVLTAPVIREPIVGGSGQISGNFNVQTANDLAILLRAGALPAPLAIIEQRTVGAELGADSVAAGQVTAIAGFVIVCAYIIITYGLFGVFACIALVFNMIMIFAAMAVLGSTLTLPGIAGLVLTLGMAVDANVLIFERAREETALGRTPVAALEAGYSRAMSAIIDSNLTTLLAVALLFFFGGGPVRGFAVTLGLGVTISMFTAIFLTRLMVVWWLRGRRPKALPI